MNNKLYISVAAACTIAANSLLANDNYDIGEITVSSATKYDQSLKDVISNVEVITKEELEEKHITTVSGALNTLSGISVTSNGGIGQLDSLFLRGVSTKRILILIDGIRYNEPTGLSGAPLAQLMIDDVAQIEVVKGAQSSIWGADASGGIINIITNKPKEGVHGSILTEAGSFNTKKYAANISAKTKKYFLKLDGSKITTDGFSSFEAKQGTANYGKRGDELGLEKDGYKNETYTAQAGVNLSDKDTLEFLFKNIDSEYDYDSSNADNLTNKSYLNHYFRSLNYKHTTNNYEAKVTLSQSKFDRVQNTFHAKSLVNEFMLQNRFKYADNSNLSVGVNKQNFEDINNKYKYQTSAVFLSNLNKFENLTVSESLRYDDNNKFDEKLTGKLSAKYNFTKDLFVSSNYGTAYNAPTLGNLSYTATLKPETTKSFDLSVGYKDFKVTYFENKIKDMIEYSFSPSFHYYNESGESKLKGYEINYEKAVTDTTILGMNYTILDAKNSNGEELQRRPEKTLKFSVDYYGIDKLHVGLYGEYVGERYDSDNKQGAQTGKYTVANFVANYDLTRTVKIYGKIDNITDKFYQTVDGYGTSPRAYYAGIKVSF